MKWRSEFGGGLDNLVPNFEYTEKPQVFEYYPQYYHKTDKVNIQHRCILKFHKIDNNRMAAQCTSNI